MSSASIVAAACQRDLPVADALNKTVAGVGPVVCREAAWRAFDGEHLPANELTEPQKLRPVSYTHLKKAPPAIRQEELTSFRLKNQRLVLLHASEAVRAVDRTVLTLSLIHI